MAKFVLKTLNSLNSVLNNSGIFYAERERLSSSKLSLLAFQDKLKNIDDTQEEEIFVTENLKNIEKRLSEPDVSCAEVEEMVKVCMVSDAMGYKPEFIYVHSLKLAQKGTLKQKHTGYLAAKYFLHSHHELVFLLINTIQKDLISCNHLEVTLALTAVCHLINSETVHNVLHLVESHLQHSVPSVRKCAILTYSHCLQLINSESAYKLASVKLERCLSDSELEVVSVVIPTLHKVIKKLDEDFSYILDSLLQLLEQIIMRRIPHCMIYSDIPAPWLQIEILKLFKHLCEKSPQSHQKLIPVLKKTLSQTGLYHAVAQAIVYQVLETTACIVADTELMEAATTSVSMLLKSRDVNMKFMGLEALILIVKKAELNISATQQDIIIDCLKLPDESLQLKTLELMQLLAGPTNAQAICSKMIAFLDQIMDSKKRDLVEKILQLAKKYKFWHDWYVFVVLSVLIKVDCLITSTDVCNILAIINQDEELKHIAKLHFKKYFAENSCAASSVIKIYVSISTEASDFLTVLSLAETANGDCLSWVLVTMMDTILKRKWTHFEYEEVSKKLANRFECSLLLELITKQMLNTVHNVGSLADLGNCREKVDPSLTCLDDYVLEHLQLSSDLYKPPDLRLLTDRSTPDVIGSNFCSVNAEEPSSPNCSNSFVLRSPAYSTLSSSNMSFQSLSNEMETFTPKTGVWSDEGRVKKGPLNEEADICFSALVHQPLPD